MNKLSDKETLRYSRHLLLKEVGLEGQLALKAATVAVVGAGGLGSPALLYLAAAGIGTLILIDDDAVELSNLQRQVLYKVNHLGQNKVTAAGKVLTSLNNQIEIVTHCKKLDDNNAGELLKNDKYGKFSFALLPKRNPFQDMSCDVFFAVLGPALGLDKPMPIKNQRGRTELQTKLSVCGRSRPTSGPRNINRPSP